jgi:hypothetical protein
MVFFDLTQAKPWTGLRDPHGRTRHQFIQGQASGDRKRE